MLLREQIKPELWLLFDRCLIIVTISGIMVIISWWKHWYYEKNNIEKLETTLNLFPYSLEYRLHVWAQYMDVFATFTAEISWLVDIEQHAEALRRVKIFADENVKKETLKKIMARMELWGDEDEAEALAALLLKQEEEFDVEAWTRKDEEELLKKTVMVKYTTLAWQPEEILPRLPSQATPQLTVGFASDPVHYYALSAFNQPNYPDLEMIWIDYWSSFIYLYRWISFTITGLWEYIPWIYIYETFERLVEDQFYVHVRYPILKFLNKVDPADIEKYKLLTEYHVFDAFLYNEYRLRTKEHLFESLTDRNAVDELYNAVQHRPWDWTVSHGHTAWLDYDFLEDSYSAAPGWAQFYHAYGQYRHKKVEDQTYFESKRYEFYESMLFQQAHSWLDDRDGRKLERDQYDLRHGTYTPWSVKTLREWRQWYWPFVTSTFLLARIFYKRYMRW